MKNFILGLFLISLANACSPVSPEQMEKLNAISTDAAAKQQAGRAAQRMIVDISGTNDLQYTIDLRPNAVSYLVKVTRIMGVTGYKAISLNYNAQPEIFQFIQNLAAGKIEVQEHTSCTNCTSATVLTLTLNTGSNRQYLYPTFLSPAPPQPIEQLNQYLKAQP